MFKKIVIFVIVAGAFAWGTKYYRMNHLTNADYVQHMAKAINSNAPILVDQNTRLDGAVAKGSELVYNYVLVNVDPSELGDLNALGQQMYQDIKSKDCGNEKVRITLSKGITLSYSYKDTDDNEIFNVSISNSDCSS